MRLQDHPDPAYAQTLTDIIRFGAKIGYTGPRQCLLSCNLSSTNDEPDLLDADISHQFGVGKLGRFDQPPAAFISSPLGLVPKSDGTLRRIHHLSHPAGLSINDHIPPEYGSLTYSTFNQALDLIRVAGLGSIMIKRDLANAIRHIPVSPEDHWLLGFQWGHHWYFDTFLPFGLRTSPYLFDLFSSTLQWMLHHHFGWDSLLHYLDDFFNVIAGHLPDAHEQAQLFGLQFNDLCLELGFEVLHKNKTSMTTDFLGLDIDTVHIEARLPPDKRLKALDLVCTFLKCKWLSQTELQSIVGFLTFAAQVVPLGRPFLRCLYNALTTSHSVPVTMDMRADLPLLARIPAAMVWRHDHLPFPRISLHLDRRSRQTRPWRVFAMGHRPPSFRAFPS
jgi:hypothetical protein